MARHSAPYRPTIDRPGQPYFDEPVLVRPTRIALACAAAMQARKPGTIVVGFNRVPLRWPKTKQQDKTK